jgi:hypothetical protein
MCSLAKLNCKSETCEVKSEKSNFMFIISFDGSKLCSSKTICNFTCLDIFLYQMCI